MSLHRDLADFANALHRRVPGVPESLLQPGSSMNRNDTVEVYRINITSARQQVLAMIYPVCELILGEECFAALARDYAWEIPVTEPDLNQFGAQFEDFMQQVVARQQGFEDYVYLPDLARLEWAWHRMYHVRTQNILSQDGTADYCHEPAKVESFIPVLNPDLVLLESPYPVYEIWQQHLAQEFAETVVMPDEPVTTVLWNYHGKADARVLSKNQRRFLQLAQTGFSLGDLMQDAELVNTKIFEEMPAMVQHGWIIRFDNMED